jgi:hypothetical protein
MEGSGWGRQRIPNHPVIAQSGGHLLDPDLHLGRAGSDVIIGDFPLIRVP